MCIRDSSIGDALVQLGQKDLLIDCQGNWGNILTGDGAAAVSDTHLDVYKRQIMPSAITSIMMRFTIVEKIHIIIYQINTEMPFFLIVYICSK